MQRRTFLFAGAAALGACAAAPTGPEPAPPTTQEHAQTLAALAPKRARPVIAVLGSPHGAETSDLLVSYGVLRQSGLAEVLVVSPTLEVMPLMPALNIRPQLDLARFDARWPDGADYVIVPALHREDDPAVLDWLRAQSSRGAILCAICAGALVLSKAGFIDGRRATTHWYRVGELRRANPHMRWVRDRRYVVDRGVATTSGVSASIPFALTLVEAIGGRTAASALAAQMGATSWGAAHDSAAFRLSGAAAWTAAANRTAFWGHERIGVPVADGVDEIGLALLADAYSETYRSSAFAIAPTPITTLRGLHLAPSPPQHIDYMLAPFANKPPVQVLNTALEDIAARYGAATAAFAALNLEYPWRPSATLRAQVTN